MDEQVDSAENPYAAPPIDADLAMANAQWGLDPTQDELIRRDHLSHEASVRSVGTLYYLGAFFLGFAAISMAAFLFLPVLLSQPRQDADFVAAPLLVRVILPGIYGFLTVLMFFTAHGLRRLQPWSRISAGILSTIGLLGFPIGTLINGCILYLLFSRKGNVVFSPEYRDIIDRTPHIKYKTSLVVKILAVVLLALFLFAIIAAIASG